MRNAIRILRFLLDASGRGEAAALLTITGVNGSVAREIGTQMAVSETGASLGSLSGGCVEAAIIGEARRIIAAGRAEQLRFGLGSPFIDIRLPCGGGMDVLVSPVIHMEEIRNACDWLEARQPVLLMLGADGCVAVRLGHDADQPGWHNGRFLVPHAPNLRLVIAGHGAETGALARLAVSFGADVAMLSPDTATVAAAARDGAEAWVLKGRQRSPHLRADRHTAVVMLFHDHDWETELLLQALEQEPFFIGAMGSRATQARRLQVLAARGVPAAALARITGPVGMLHAARDPETLALSALGQIVGCYRESLTIRLQPDAMAAD
jgi:xanthine dehydrogenase accessory factor